MLAVAEAAVADQLAELDEAIFHIVTADVAQAKFADTRRVDQVATVGEVVQPRRGGGVRALARPFRQVADTGASVGQQAVDQRRLAHARLADEHADMAIQRLLQALHAIALMGGDLQQRIAEVAVHLEHGVEGRCVFFVDQVGLVQQQQRTNAGVFGCNQVAIDQVGVRLGGWGEDDDDQVDVGRHRLELAMVVRPAQLGAARHLRDDHADALVAGAPHHAIAGDQRRQVGAQVAAEDLAGRFAVLGLDLDLHTEVGDHQAQLLRPQVATLQLLQHMLLAFGGAGGALALDLFDAPVLAAVELAFGHEGSVSAGQKENGRQFSTARPRPTSQVSCLGNKLFTLGGVFGTRPALPLAKRERISETGH